ncbi:DNA polymerase III subunit delta [Paraferrimonas sedimenticola]|uniref:DNA polymerase III subunit delta n=1 Tax=Paraferrimonas sedimenticola TaxID=375674 RepID=A0AA37RZE0_9GAMM|nr:DNA polymerase III subunit delta [Paraferrimonas sedimenticola]GLP98011.1 DNA polymerase III subunit delta [Paraferrimonas sedimenticola]
MRIFSNQLDSHLTPLKPVYLLFGDDPFVLDNALQSLRAAARAQGFEERVQLSQDTGFQWQELFDEWNALSLFASKRLFELELPTAKPGKEGGAALTQLLAEPNPDQVLIVYGPKIAAESTKTKWFKTLDAQGVYLPCTTPEGPQFSRWLSQRVQHYRLNLSQDANALLAAMFEGNLVGADQALKQMQLLSPIERIEQAQVEQWLEDQSRFSVFQLVDTLLVLAPQRSMHMLKQLQAEGVASQVVLWSLNQELGRLLLLKQAQQNRESLAPIYKAHRIWDKRQPLYQQALARLSLEQIQSMLQLSSRIESELKFHGEESWAQLAQLCLLFDPSAHAQLPVMEVR